MVTINVAINSHSKALLTVMVSNQFVELKGNVFKKFDDRNLFQMSCSDIRERFHYVVILLIVTIRNLAQFSWNIDHLGVLLPLIVLIFLSEVFVDWIKHGFITKFNSISPNVYQKYSSILAKDLRNRRTKMSPSEYSDLVSRRMGFTPLPLTCVLSQTLITFLEFPGYSGKLCLVIIFLCLLSLKILLGITLLGVACQHKDTPTQDNEPQERSNQTGLITPPELKHRKTKTSKSQSLSEIERFTLSGNRIV